MKTIKNRLMNMEITLGSWITIGHPIVAEIMSKSGFDWLVIDMEHSVITLDIAQSLIQIVELNKCVPLVRVNENNPSLIKRIMDAGAHGVIIPMVNSKEEALRAVKAVKYPPLGTRGVGLARAQGYGLEFKKYKDWVNSESIVIVQIEHIKAIENLEEILSVEGVDGFIVGPYDLSASIGIPGEFEHPTIRSALKDALKISKKIKKPAGFHVIPPKAEELTSKINEGYQILGFSLDTLFLGQSCLLELKKIKEKLK